MPRRRPRTRRRGLHTKDSFHGRQKQTGDCSVSDNSEQEEGFSWATLVARVLHPIDVQIIEALQRLEQPLSASDLAQVLFDGEQSWATLGRHLRRLAKLDAIELGETPMFKDVTDISYRLAVKRKK